MQFTRRATKKGDQQINSTYSFTLGWTRSRGEGEILIFSRDIKVKPSKYLSQMLLWGIKTIRIIWEPKKEYLTSNSGSTIVNWTSYLTPLCLSYLICKQEQMAPSAIKCLVNKTKFQNTNSHQLTTRGFKFLPVKITCGLKVWYIMNTVVKIKATESKTFEDFYRLNICHLP